MSLKAVIFDLDGVIVSTDEYHYQGWKRMADEEGIYFDREINERLRGVSRMESLNIVLEKSLRQYSDSEKALLAERKNNYYRLLLENITPADILPGVLDALNDLKKRGIKIAIASSSKNAPVILENIELDGYFDAVADGNDIKNSKPDPEVFLLAAERMHVCPSRCAGVEDAVAGIDSIIAAQMLAVGVGFASSYPKAHCRIKDMSAFDFEALLCVYARFQKRVLT